MLVRFALVFLGILGVSGPSLRAGATADRLSQARSLWEKGQRAMREGRAARAVELYTQSLACAPSLGRNHLSLAAAYLELGNPALACFHLEEYVQSHREDLLARVQLAELLVRMNRRQAARRELESCVELAQELSELPSPGASSSQGGSGDRDSGAGHLLIHCHSRLMEIAESQGDAYAEHLSRGIGLLLLAGEAAASPETEKELPSEGLYCKAAGELTLALDERPGEARPSWYLHLVWSRLGQLAPARRCLREAVALDPFSYLTPVERRRLHLANPVCPAIPFLRN